MNVDLSVLQGQRRAVYEAAYSYAFSQGWTRSSPDTWSHPFMDKGAIVYVSGPMSNLYNFNREGFWLAEAALNLVGVETRSPAHWPIGNEYHDYMRLDYKLVLESNTVFALKGWKASAGARIEIDMAKSLGYAIHEEV